MLGLFSQIQQPRFLHVESFLFLGMNMRVLYLYVPEYPLCLTEYIRNYHPWSFVAGSLMNEDRTSEIGQVVRHLFCEALPDAPGKTTWTPLSQLHHNLPCILVCLSVCLIPSV